MLKGDLATTSLADVLRALADDARTGCLRIDHPYDECARVYLREGKVYAVVLPGRTPRLGARLVASGQLSPADLAEATEAQHTELQGWRLGELLVHLGYVEQSVVEAFVGEQLRETAADLMLWSAGRFRFRDSERTREDVAPPLAVDDLLADVDRRRAEWDAVAPLVHGPDAVPVLSAAGTAPESQHVDADAWSLLCAIDGERSLSALAAAGGLSLYEAGKLVASLVDAGLVDVEPAAAEVVVDAPSVNVQVDIAPGSGAAAIAARLADALRGLGPVPEAMAATPMPGEDLHRGLEPRHDTADVDTTIERASEELAAALGPPAGELELFPVDSAPRHAPVVPLDAKQAERRARDAHDLAERQAEVEAARVASTVVPLHSAAQVSVLPVSHLATVVEIDAGRRVAPDAVASDAVASDAAAPDVTAGQDDAAPGAALTECDALTEYDATADVPGADDAAEAVEAAAQEAAQEVAHETAHETAAREAAASEAAARAAAEAARDHQRLSAAIQAEAFAELTAAATFDAPQREQHDEPQDKQAAAVADDEPADADVPAHDEPSYAPRGADTAALLRELSSLGLDDEPAPAPMPQPRPMPPVSIAAKKRKGLFGRG